MDNEINFSNYTTRRKYDGCHPVIAKGLQQENPIFLLCRVWDDCTSNEWIVTDYKRGRYKAGGLWWDHAEPIKKKKKVLYVKGADYLNGWFKGRKCEFNIDGSCSICRGSGCPGIIPDMWNYCGKPKPYNYDYHPDWLEEREEVEI